MSNCEPTVLAIDIGSSQTHIAAVDVEKLLCADRVDFDNRTFDGQFIPSIKDIVQRNPHIRWVNISSCIRDLAIKANKYCVNEGCFDNVEIVEAHDGLLILLNYETPEKLGADRICNALACSMLFGDESCIIIDSGTAVTVDCLHRGKMFEGGAILPGVLMQINALHSGTDALPFVKLNDLNCGNSNATDFPATSTERCIKTGVLYGIAGAIERIIRKYAGDNTRIVATGGGWEIIKPQIGIGRPITVIPDLTLIGAAVYSPNLGK